MQAALNFNPSEIVLFPQSLSLSQRPRSCSGPSSNSDSAAIGTSFQGAGLVTIHQAVAAGIPLPVFTIDTGLLFRETLELKTRLERFFGIAIEALVPELTVQQQAQEIAPDLWSGQSGSLLHIAQGRAATEETWSARCLDYRAPSRAVGGKS